jgi:hypothetical protein
MPFTLENYNPGGTNILTPAQFPQDARWTAGRFAPSKTIAAGAYLGKYTNTSLSTVGLLDNYSPSNTNGLGTAVGLNMITLATDASGNVFNNSGMGTNANSLNLPALTSPYFTAGTFDPADLSGGDANALTNLNAITDGVTGFVRIPN